MSPEQSLKRALGSLTDQTSKKPRNYEREDNEAINIEEQTTTDSNRNATIRNGGFSKVRHEEAESRTVVIVSDLEDEDDTESEEGTELERADNQVPENTTTERDESVQPKEDVSEGKGETMYITIDDDSGDEYNDVEHNTNAIDFKVKEEDNNNRVSENTTDASNDRKDKASEEDVIEPTEKNKQDKKSINVPVNDSRETEAEAMEVDEEITPIKPLGQKKKKQDDSEDDFTLPGHNSTYVPPPITRPKRKPAPKPLPVTTVVKKPKRSNSPREKASFEHISKRRLLKTGFVYDTAMSYHATPDPIEIHPEDPRRIFKIYSIMEKHGLLAECKRIKSRKATKKEIIAIHSITHYRKMRATTKFNKRSQYIELEHVYDSVYLNSSSFESALYAAGSLIELLEALVKDEIRNAFAIIRPPGHHAEHDAPMGFCLFNNVAVAVNHCMKKLDVKKTVIVDWDVHFGNGTQSIFSSDPNVLYISLHRYEDKTFYPSSRKGAADYTGHGKGKGTTVNIPWPCSGMTDADYLYAFREIVIPISMEFNPDLLVVSAGFDAAIDDPIGQCKVTPVGYAHMVHMLKSVNNGKMAIALEGGYNLNSTAMSALACMNVLLGDAPPPITSNLAPKKECIETIEQVREIQKEFWTCL
ncbi:Histone deacetylase hda1 [Rhizopus azygosporus]|uniref:histone deacetylase n=1 Tax=Rhizopus azygosporus TaxID=86630 RepID=A0A367JY87_RHIAZ|nr:Histone deacetylase hda1 [Rhizopus azygosporus]